MNLHQAKRLYQKWNCSAFSMAREDSAYNNEFCDLHIPRATLEEWSTEHLKERLKIWEKDPSYDNFCDVRETLDNHGTEANVELFVNFLKKVDLTVSLDDIAICDVILGMRNLNIRCGYLDFAMDSKRKDLYDFLYNYVEHVLTTREAPDNRKQRFEDMKDVFTHYPKSF